MSSLTKQIKTHYELSLQLYPEYREPYGDIVTYLRTSSLSELEAEEVIGDVLDMLLDAQQRREKIENVIGDDLQQFCDDIIAANGPVNKQRKQREIISTSIFSFVLLWGLECIGSTSIAKQGYVDFYLHSLLYIFALIFGSIIIMNYTGQKTFKVSFLSKNMMTGILVALLLVGMLLIEKLLDHNYIVLFSLPIYIFVPLIATLLSISWWLYYKR